MTFCLVTKPQIQHLKGTPIQKRQIKTKAHIM